MAVSQTSSGEELFPPGLASSSLAGLLQQLRGSGAPMTGKGACCMLLGPFQVRPLRGLPREYRQEDRNSRLSSLYSIGCRCMKGKLKFAAVLKLSLQSNYSTDPILAPQDLTVFTFLNQGHAECKAIKAQFYHSLPQFPFFLAKS